MNTTAPDPPISLFSMTTSRLVGQFMRETSSTRIGGEIEVSFSITFSPSESNVLFNCLKMGHDDILSTLDLWCLPQELFNTLHCCPHSNVAVGSATLLNFWNWTKNKAAAYLVWVMVTWGSCCWCDLVKAAIIICILSSLLSSRSCLLSSLLSSRSCLLSSLLSSLSSRSPSCLWMFPRRSSLSLKFTQSLRCHFPDFSLEYMESMNYLIMVSAESMAAWAEFRRFMLLGVTRCEVSIRRRSLVWKF